jgi:L-iditol 2-dehydrogenase
MRAVVLGSDGTAGLRDVPVPRPRAGELLVRVTAVGLCGSDVEKLAGGGAREGSVLGHEIVGVVEAGPLPVGTRVAVAHRVPCGACERCSSGHETTCDAFLASGLRPGGFAERVVAPAAHVAGAVLVLPDHVDDLAGAFVEPLACILRARDLLPRGAGAVVGCGAVGLLFGRALTERGDRVRVIEPDPVRLERALATADGQAQAGDELDFAVVTAPAGLDAALRVVRPGGTVLVFAAPSGAVTLDLDTVYRRELVLVGSRSGSPASLVAARDAIAAGRITVGDLVSDVLPLTSFLEGLQRYRSRRALKVVYRP